MRVVVDDNVDRLQVYNGDIKPSTTNCPNLFLKRFFLFGGVNRTDCLARERFTFANVSTPYLGGYSAEVPPLPIPNRVVKLSIADGTALRCGRVGSRHF